GTPGRVRRGGGAVSRRGNGRLQDGFVREWGERDPGTPLPANLPRPRDGAGHRRSGPGRSLVHARGHAAGGTAGTTINGSTFPSLISRGVASLNRTVPRA